MGDIIDALRECIATEGDDDTAAAAIAHISRLRENSERQIARIDALAGELADDRARLDDAAKVIASLRAKCAALDAALLSHMDDWAENEINRLRAALAEAERAVEWLKRWS